MRLAGAILGMFAGFAGVYVAQLLVTGTALISLLAAALGSSSAGAPITLGVLALAAYTLGIIGGAICLQRPGVGAILMLVGAVGGAVATIAIGPATLGAFNSGATAAVPLAPSPSPSPAAGSSSTSAVLAVPFAPPLLLLVAATLSFMSIPRATLVGRSELMVVVPSVASQPMRRRTLVLGIGAAAVVVTLALAAYVLTQRGQSDSASASVSATATPTASPVPTPTPRPTPTPDATIAPMKVGDPLTYTNGWTVTVTKWQEQPPARFSTPAPGLRFVVITVRLDNASTVTVTASPGFFKLQDSSGIRRSGEIFIDRNDQLATSNVAPGGLISGTIVFAAPVGDTKLTVVYDQLGYRQATWQLY
jgi:uncharacterized protein DUF4352